VEASGDGERLDGLAVVVTGGLGDIGLAIVSRLSRHGALVSAWDLLPADRGERVLAEHGATAAYAQVDITDRGAVGRELQQGDRLDVLFANAGISVSAPFLDITAEQWEEHMRTNLTGSFTVAQAAARAMVRRGQGGRVVFTGSWIEEVPWPEQAAYSASKAGVRMLARSMALELAPHRVLVNVLSPGIVDAGMARRQRLADPQYAERAGSAIPLGAMQTAQQVAAVAHFLCSAGADYITGTVLLADGGASLHNRL
jgi:NAD(P)-dependent dehydrogenase (short-subunit alcohol dehydrogenase family)